MTGAPLDLITVIERMAPGAALTKTWPLEGGISSRMTAFEFTEGGARRQAILREPGKWAFRQNAKVAAHEYMLLKGMGEHGVPVSEPLYLDEENNPPRYLVVAYADGAPDYRPERAEKIVKRAAPALAAIHNAPLDGFRGLPDQNDRWRRIIYGAEKQMDADQGELRIRKRLKRLWPPPFNPPVVQHGDFWPGNYLWKKGKLTAVIDWEDAGIGDPLYDLAVSRLDLLWAFGKKAMESFTAAYLKARPVDTATLPVWELCVALRPLYNFSEWASLWPAQGRSDITEATMRADHKWFVKNAFKRLSKAPAPTWP